MLTLGAFQEMIDLHEFINNDVWIIRDSINLSVLGGGRTSAKDDVGTYRTICKLNYLQSAEKEEEGATDAMIDSNVSMVAFIWFLQSSC